MSHRQDTIWQAEPHTIAKIEMVRAYLFVWLSILAAKFAGTGLWYIDGFAGPGEYTNYPDGSPVAAIKAADRALTDASRWIAGDVHCVFMEEDARRFANLTERIAELPPRDRRHVHLFEDTFVGGMERLGRQNPNPFVARSPIFAFIDPFGPRGLAFSVVRQLLSGPACEVLINLDSDGIARVYRAGESANHRERLNEVFGDTDWEQELQGVSREGTASKVLDMYKRRLRAIPKVNFAFAFGMLSKGDRLDYHLVFASQHPLGLEKMKEVMKRIAGDGSYTFSDEHDGQQTLFRFDEPEFHAVQLEKFFLGRTIPYAEVHAYALNESPFVNPKKMLTFLESTNRVTVASSNTARRKCTYPEDMQRGITIRFHGVLSG